MREIKYTLYPDVAGRFVDKRSSLRHFLWDVNLLRHRNVPPEPILNELLARGCTGRVGEWEPFVITHQEYRDLIESLLADPKERFRVLDPPTEIQSAEQWEQWLHSIGLA